MAPHKKKPDDRQFKVGDRILVSLSSGRVEEAAVKAVIQESNETRLIVDYGFDETATVSLWQVRQESKIRFLRSIKALILS